MKNKNQTKSQSSHNKDRKIKAALATSTIVAGLGGGIGIGYAIWYTRNANNNNSLPSSLKIIGTTASLGGNINSPLSSPRLYCSTDTDVVVSDAQYSFDTSSSIPEWLTINSTTGEITGTPPDGSLGEYQIPIKVSSQAYPNLAGNTTIKLTIEAKKAKSLEISGAVDIEGNAQTQIEATDQLSCKTDTGNEVTSVVYKADDLPDGLEIDKDTGIISGTPDDEGFGIYTITATADGLTGSISKAFKIDSQIVESFTINVPTEPITGNALYELTTDELSCSVNGTVIESGVSYSASSLPKGLSIDKDTGIISGTPVGPTANGTTATITANYTEGGKNLVATAGMVFNISNTLVISRIKLASDSELAKACNLHIDADGVLNRIDDWTTTGVNAKFNNYLAGLGNFKTTAILFEGVGSISEDAFNGCEALKYAGSIKSIRFAESPIGNSTSIGSHAFNKCTGLKTIDLSSTNISSIEENAFDACTNLTNISLPSSLTEIGSRAFAGCTALTTVDLSKTKLTSIGNFAFAPSNSYATFCGLTTINFPDSLETIGSNAFNNCTGLKTIDLSSTNISSIGDSAFYECKGLTKINFPNSLKLFGKYAFAGCAFTNIPSSFLEAVESIGNGLFCENVNLITIDLLNTKITSIEDWAFSECTGLTTLKLSSVMFEENNTAFIGGGTTLNGNSFYGCTSLNAIYIPAGAASMLNGNRNNKNAFTNCGAGGKIYYYDEGSKAVAESFKNFFNDLKSSWTVEEAPSQS